MEKPWSGARSGAYNRITKKPYSLLNQLLLKHDGEYATFAQWKNLGGKIRKGEKSEIITFWKVLPIEEEKADGTKEEKLIPFLRYYNVFHVSQVEGVEPLTVNLNDEIEPIEEADKILNDYITREGIKLEHMISDKAYYSPTSDKIHLPLLEQFKNVNEYYSTAFHEATHSTMTKDRCDRKQEIKLLEFGSEDYSKEELVAEMGSAFIMYLLGLGTVGTKQNSTAYIQSWITVLRNDVKFVVSASSKAEKAVKYILNKK